MKAKFIVNKTYNTVTFKDLKCWNNKDVDFLKKMEKNKHFEDFFVTVKKSFTEILKGFALILFLIIVLFGTIVLNINCFLTTKFYK